jgi:ABC-2 type transport system ATP-binding protein
VACFGGIPHLPDNFKILHMSNTGRVHTLIVRGDKDAAVHAILEEKGDKTIVDVLPLTLEEIFIYEMGGVDYEVKEILF